MITLLNLGWIAVSAKPGCWVLWFWCNEAGWAVLQVGPLVIELTSNAP